MLQKVGESVDGRVVVSGVYRFYETHGIPLDVLLESMQAKSLLPDWLAFLREAQAAGMKKERVLSMLDAAVSDVYGGAFRDHVLRRLQNEA
jgi:alanyl-tRNA synthetase